MYKKAFLAAFLHSGMFYKVISAAMHRKAIGSPLPSAMSYLVFCCPLQANLGTSSTCSWLTQTRWVKLVKIRTKRRRWRGWPACPSPRQTRTCACHSGITCLVNTQERFTSSTGGRRRRGRSCGRSVAIRAVGGGRDELYCHTRASPIR